MCKNLVEKGNLDKPLVLYNRTKKRADDLASQLGGGKAQVCKDRSAPSLNECLN